MRGLHLHPAGRFALAGGDVDGEPVGLQTASGEQHRVLARLERGEEQSMRIGGGLGHRTGGATRLGDGDLHAAQGLAHGVQDLAAEGSGTHGQGDPQS
ncbi:hypothetical protein SVIO_094080 [Streptomyces violaceusniger]|uniref:Uncharacterized protein n=1 Tax=Streptomyces violaceusniger TaxID=68280 RepID=A0A4D4LCF6_STRVO|nr:hypothetical protein SVIO_094080 [Streptomyces violaceusniger]